ncbi:YgaP family membrane protein [Herminiimonas contaminans]|uniref:DUF2892 domain-containing protein n=1 Tax=Herminiimonas contaminans TaxID=1111140 RepID=A0ABS0EU40_9BURK|nr:DUF2892 domain-containing protein [Herminiimonas contaminans]MBF8178358.1 DUF2892 domain-containing protein [Herminiimonas contaminans]
MKNVGNIDRGLRIAVGVGLVLMALMGYVGWWAYIGVIPLLTGIVGFCPAYSVFACSTCPKEEK